MVVRDLGDAPARRGGLRSLLQNVGGVARSGCIVVGLEQEPCLLLLARLWRHADEVPLAFQLLAVEAEFEVPLLVAERGVELRFPGPLVPYHDGAGAIFSFR